MDDKDKKLIRDYEQAIDYITDNTDDIGGEG